MKKHEAKEITYGEVVRGTQEEKHREIGPPRRFRTQNQQSTKF
jgi:hypothetical protein